MNGLYFYGDYNSGEIWAVETDPPGAFPNVLHVDTSHRISTFGEDAYGELYLADLGNGRIYRLQDDNEVAYLHIEKAAPVTAVAGQPFTYTLTVQNSGGFTMSNVRISDTLPVGASYISGGAFRLVRYDITSNDVACDVINVNFSTRNPDVLLLRPPTRRRGISIPSARIIKHSIIFTLFLQDNARCIFL